MKIQPNGIYFKSSKSGDIIQINDSDVVNLEWMRVARGFEVKVVSSNGSVTKFDGFKESVGLSEPCSNVLGYSINRTAL